MLALRILALVAGFGCGIIAAFGFTAGVLQGDDVWRAGSPSSSLAEIHRSQRFATVVSAVLFSFGVVLVQLAAHP